MSTSQILWIDLQPSLYCLFKRTAQSLGQHFEVKRWSFEHDLDESCDVEVVHSLMRHTIENSSNPVHLIGHGISGTIAYLFAQKYPNNISSVSVLSVDTHSTNQWTSHYQSMRSQLPCSRFHILSHLSRLLVDRKLFKSGSSCRPRSKWNYCIFVCSKISQPYIISFSIVSRYLFNKSMD